MQTAVIYNLPSYNTPLGYRNATACKSNGVYQSSRSDQVQDGLGKDTTAQVSMLFEI